MRIIKFRAFNKEQNKMLDLAGISFTDFGTECLTKLRYTDGFCHYCTDENILMQFTGLSLAKKTDGFNKDGNYKTWIELFEGDIVELMQNPEFYVGNYFKIGMRFVCAYLNNGFVFLPISHFNEYIKHGSTSVSIHGSHPLNSIDTYRISNHFEVIGNIYENKELL